MFCPYNWETYFEQLNFYITASCRICTSHKNAWQWEVRSNVL